MYAWRARDALGLPQETVDLIADRISRCARGPVLPLPERAPEPDQLELRAVCAHRDGHGRQRAAGQRLPRAGRAILRRHHAAPPAGRLAEPRARLPVPLPAARPPTTRSTSTAPSTRARPATSSSITSRPAGRHAAARRRSTPPAARLDRAHRLRLLDPRRLPELGHGLRLQALARRPHLGARPAGPARDRVSPRFHNAPELGSGRSTCSTAGSASTSASRARRRTAKGIAPSNLYDVDVAPLGPEHPGAVRGPHAGERRARGRARPGRERAAEPPAALLLRRRHRAAGRHHPEATRPPCCR